jgi:hypothetical protein
MAMKRCIATPHADGFRCGPVYRKKARGFRRAVRRFGRRGFAFWGGGGSTAFTPDGEGRRDRQVGRTCSRGASSGR